MTQVALENVLHHSDCLFTQAEVEAALDKIVPFINRDYAGKNPVILAVMNGALPTLGYLLPRFDFLLQADYIHATRYKGAESGGNIIWKAKPETSLADRHVLIVDDILDRGITLSVIRDYCLAQGALSVKIAVLGEKQIDGFVPEIQADYRALYFPDRYVYGYGMDFQEHWRNAPGIYAFNG